MTRLPDYHYVLIRVDGEQLDLRGMGPEDLRPEVRRVGSDSAKMPSQQIKFYVRQFGINAL
jgi:hypothetical protein